MKCSGRFLPYSARRFKFVVQGLVSTMFAAAFCAGGTVALAEEARFIRTHQGVHQLVDGTIQVMNAEAKDIAGLFIRVGERIEPQGFSPSEIDPSTSETAFIKYDPRTNRYTELILGENSVRIAGSFSFQMGSVRVGIDNVNQYVSIVSGNAILGFLGTGLIVNNDKAVLLEANQFSNYREIMKPYVLLKGELSLSGKPLKGEVVGLTLEQPKNSCLPGSNAVYLKAEDLSRIKRTKDKQERLTLLERALRKEKDWNPFQTSMLIIQIKADPGAIVGINYAEGNVQQISKLSSTAVSRKICVVENLPLR